MRLHHRLKQALLLLLLTSVLITLVACQNSAKDTTRHKEARTIQLAQKKKQAEKRQQKTAAKIKKANYNVLNDTDKNILANLKLTAIGDSVMEGAGYKYSEIFPQISLNTSVSRQIYELPDILTNLLNQNQLNNTVLIGLGTNGTYSPDQMASIMTLLGSKRKIYWLNVHTPDSPWETEVNKKLKRSAKKYHNLTIIDWSSYSKTHPDWFVSDHTHPTTSGIEHLVTFVAKSISLNIQNTN